MSGHSLVEVLRILESQNLTELDDTKKAIAKVSNEISKNKENIKIHIEKNFNNLYSNVNSTENILNEGENIIREVKNILKEIENETKLQLQMSDNEIEHFKEELLEIFLGLKIAQKLLKIDELFEQLEEIKKTEDTLVIMEIVGKLKSLIFDGNDKVLPRLVCYQQIKVKYYTESEMLLCNLNQQFDELVKLEENISNDDIKITTIKISKDQNKLKNIIIGLFNAKYNPTKICSFLLSKTFEPIIKTEVSLNFNEDNICEYNELILSYKVKSLTMDLEKPNYNTVLDNIVKVLNFLHIINIQISETICVFKIFGKFLKDRFLESLINKCLVHSIPDVSEEMRDSTFIKDILKFNEILIDFQLIDINKDKELISFIDNVVMLSKNRFHKKCIDEAINIMKKDLYNMVRVEKSVSSDLVNQKYAFPQCMVSKSILELVTLLNKIIEEEDEKSFAVISSIINYYIEEVPKYHEKMLKSIPQQTALFFNNTMHLANWLLSHFDDDNGEVQNLFQLLENLASEYFAKEVETQHNNLYTFFKNFDLSDAVSELGSETQKVILQCLRQLDLLKNVWQSILTDDMYNNTMLNLIDDFCKELIKNIMIIEDISSAVSTELVEIIDIIEERIPRLFEDQNIIIQAKFWLKLKQLKTILGASMLQITELWLDGVGPLSLNFKAEEIRHLIRALFQNTERRANTLASII
ncbi:centromere/kinetochore protein zw10-like [Condylostylus longicornis]|uniref:centromere/kinetochore protein zw10-like n=1 Tax=Condylostylus longicornis TaxID=2530218 RepID=UPI00244E0387|nr:centromere/kinetochore protein zw10-like [Condylostylus longicornis]